MTPPSWDCGSIRRNYDSEEQNRARRSSWLAVSNNKMMSNNPTNNNQIIWDGSAMSQFDMMEKDTVLVVDNDDNVIGSASKKESHICNQENPRGILHRAFSVFLFDECTGEMLLQKRASTKITFPNVWTNTCCSHPLHGMVPREVDTPQDVTDGTVYGVKHAAVRKLNHELGIPPHQLLPIEKFKFLTRLHYWAVDTVTHGVESPWVEHEIDYVLFITIHNAKNVLTIQPDPDEVEDTLWVTREELVQRMTKGLWSPWFRILANQWLIPPGGWWENLTETMTTNKQCHYSTIHRFDPPTEHMGGQGKAGSYLGNIYPNVASR